MNVTDDFTNYLTTVTGATLGQDLWIGIAPSTNEVTDPVWWVRSSGGIKNKTSTGEAMKQYVVNVYYRSKSIKDVYDQLQSLEETINSDGCTQLTNYDTVDIEAQVLTVDEDLDNQDRMVGVLEILLTIYKGD